MRWLATPQPEKRKGLERMSKRIIKRGFVMRPRKEDLKVDVTGYIYGVETGPDDGDYLLLGSENLIGRLITKTDAYRGIPYKEYRVKTIDVDGVPTAALFVSKKFTRHLLAQDTVHSIYTTLTQYFTESDMRLVFYRLWLDEHNYLAGESNRKAFNKAVGRRKPTDRDHGYIHHITTSMTVREAGKYGTV